MNKLPLTKEELLAQYKLDVDQLLDDCDWISYIDDWRMCGIVASILNRAGVPVSTNDLLKLYEEKVKSLNITDQEWRDQYADWNTGLPKIFDMIYEILENKFAQVK